jgi:folate-dependent phosphoribosylglycinamide formyltransferase PurN
LGNRIKIGLLLDDSRIPQWVFSLIGHINADERFDICLVILNKAAKSSTRSSFVYRLLRKADQKLMRLPGDPFKRVEIPELNAKKIEVIPLQKKFSDYFPDVAIKEVKNAQPDILLRFGFRILRGEILKAARYGIMSLHHGDTDAYRGGPPAFWEVVNKEPITGVTLQLLTEQLDAGVILSKAFLRTDTSSFYRNQQKLYWAGLKLFKTAFEEMAVKGADKYFEEKRSLQHTGKPGRLYRNPDNIKALGILLNYFGRNISRQLHSFLYNGQWQLFYCFRKDGSAERDVKAMKKLLPPKDRIWADPFVVKDKNVYHLFFEEKLNKKDEAHVSLLRFNENGKQLDEKPQVVLQEPHHLSYPFVFAYDDKYWMIPEAAASCKITLYVAEDFPFKWKPVRDLLQNIKAYDATLHLHEDGNWYLFCSAKENDHYSSNAYLHIYYAKDLLKDNFMAHPLNPVYQDVRLARPAGKIFCDNGMLIRPSQLSTPVYGYGIVMNLITELSTTSFKETQLHHLLPDWQKNLLATHTFNSEEGFTVLDAQVDRFKW